MNSAGQDSKDPLDTGSTGPAVALTRTTVCKIAAGDSMLE